MKNTFKSKQKILKFGACAFVLSACQPVSISGSLVPAEEFSKAVSASVSSARWGKKAIRDFAGELQRGAGVNGWHTEGGIAFSVNDFVVVKAGASESGVPAGAEGVGLVTGLAMGPAGGPTVRLRMYVPAPLADPDHYARKYPDNRIAHWILQTEHVTEAAAESILRRAQVVPTPFWENNNAHGHGFVIVGHVSGNNGAISIAPLWTTALERCVWATSSRLQAF